MRKGVLFSLLIILLIVNLVSAPTYPPFDTRCYNCKPFLEPPGLAVDICGSSWSGFDCFPAADAYGFALDSNCECVDDEAVFNNNVCNKDTYWEYKMRNPNGDMVSYKNTISGRQVSPEACPGSCRGSGAHLIYYADSISDTEIPNTRRYYLCNCPRPPKDGMPLESCYGYFGSSPYKTFYNCRVVRINNQRLHLAKINSELHEKIPDVYPDQYRAYETNTRYSLSCKPPSYDPCQINKDCPDIHDLVILAESWLDGCDMDDFAELSANWLKECEN